MKSIVDVLKDEKGYYFELESLGYGRDKYYKVFGKKAEGGKVYTTGKEPIIEVYQSITKNIKVVSLIDGEPDLTIDEYERKKLELENKRVPDKYDEYMVFENLDDEYEYKKFLKNHKIISRVDEVLVQTLELDIKEKLKSDNPFIDLHRHIGKGLTSQAATYNRWGFYKQYTRKFLDDLGYQEVNSTGNSKNTYKIFEYNNGMVNLYIEGEQLFDIKVFSFSDDLQTVEKKYEEDKQWIEEKINAYMKNTRNLPSVQDVITQVSSIRNRVAKIDYKVKSYDDYQGAMRSINNFLDELEKGLYSK